ncbi:PAS domain-containing sensor histidine kinase, partial [Bacteroidota bacterium]
MGYKSILLKIIIRIVILALAMLALLYYLLIEKNYLRVVYVSLVIITSVLEFIRHINRTNKDFMSFLESIINEDFTTYYSGERKTGSVKKIYNYFNLITEKYRKIRTEKEIQYLYLQTLIEQIEIGILTISSDGKIDLVNKALKRLLNKPNLSPGSKLNELEPEFLKVVKEIKPGQRKLVKIDSWDESYKVSVLATDIKLLEKSYKLVSAHNIKGELEEYELEAWQKLIRVLTHEIMNSVTPITSLSSSLFDMLENKRNNNEIIEEKTINTIADGLDAIIDRSKGLAGLTGAYKKLTRLPVPEFEIINIKEFIKNIDTLYSTRLQEQNIELIISFEEEVDKLYTDPELVKQVLINLINNSVESIIGLEDAIIKITIGLNLDQKVFISVEDNGPGIHENIIEKIFIPFYTTKDKGSGIGLSLS